MTTSVPPVDIIECTLCCKGQGFSWKAKSPSTATCYALLQQADIVIVAKEAMQYLHGKIMATVLNIQIYKYLNVMRICSIVSKMRLQWSFDLSICMITRGLP